MLVRIASAVFGPFSSGGAEPGSSIRVYLPDAASLTVTSKDGTVRTVTGGTLTGTGDPVFVVEN